MQGTVRIVVVLFVVLLAVPVRAVADVEILLSNGDVVPGRSVTHEGDEFVIRLFGGESVHVARRLVDAIRFTESTLLQADDAGPPVEIVLLDGRVLTAVSMHRRDDVYVLDLGGGGLVTIPVALVSETRGAEAAPDRATEPRPTDDAGSTSLPPSMIHQLGVFRGPSDMRRSETWQPTDTYGWANDITYFDPARWNDNFDSRWRPTSAVRGGTNSVGVPPRTRRLSSAFW